MVRLQRAGRVRDTGRGMESVGWTAKRTNWKAGAQEPQNRGSGSRQVGNWNVSAGMGNGGRKALEMTLGQAPIMELKRQSLVILSHFSCVK